MAIEFNVGFLMLTLFPARSEVKGEQQNCNGKQMVDERSVLILIEHCSQNDEAQRPHQVVSSFSISAPDFVPLSTVLTIALVVGISLPRTRCTERQRKTQRASATFEPECQVTQNED